MQGKEQSSEFTEAQVSRTLRRAYSLGTPGLIFIALGGHVMDTRFPFLLFFLCFPLLSGLVELQCTRRCDEKSTGEANDSQFIPAKDHKMYGNGTHG